MKLWHLALVSAALIAAGCEQKTPEVTAQQPADQSLTQMDTPPATTADPYATDPYATGAVGKPQDTGIAGKETRLISGQPAAGGRRHTVQKGDTYFGLARKYYNDQSKWKTIYEANRGRYPDKNKIPVGAELIIP
jgi:5'-nucleotidase/UDP-sugar diphosphatase